MAVAATKIVWSRAFHSFSTQGRALRGVHPIITRAFYPKYSYNTAHHGPDTGSPNRPKSQKLTRFKPGMRAGSLLDNELIRTIKLCRKFNLPTLAFASHEKQVTYAKTLAGSLTKQDKASFLKKSSIATLRVWQTFVKMNLKPLRAQVPVGSLELRAGTGVDVECSDDMNQKVIIDTKLGFQSYYHKHTGNVLQYIQPPHTDCPANQHQLQLLLTYELYRLTYPGTKMGTAYIFRVDCFGVEVIPMQDWVKQNASNIFKVVKALH